jgi:hypothetical protein
METIHYHKLRHKFVDLPNAAKSDRLMADIILPTNGDGPRCITARGGKVGTDRHKRSAEKCYAHTEAQFPTFIRFRMFVEMYNSQFIPISKGCTQTI